MIHEEDYYFVKRVKLVGDQLNYDVKITDSIISPYILEISFTLLGQKNFRNKEFLRDEYKKGYKKKEYQKKFPVELLDSFAFRSKDEALSYLSDEDFGIPNIYPDECNQI